MDIFSKAKRSEVMKKIKSVDTAPEMKIRSLLFRRGLRYRLHVKGMPGRPDIVFSRNKTAIFVNGCFWHGHTGCKKGKLRPVTNAQFWRDKIERNRLNDIKHKRKLKRMGWNVIVVWECEVRNAGIIDRVEKYLGEHIVSGKTGNKSI